MIFGLDIYQGDDAPATPQHVDFARMKAQGMEYVIVKASQGMHEDALYRAHVVAAQSAGLITGAYHFLDRTAAFGDQMKVFINALKAAPVNLPPFLDYELNLVSSGEAGLMRTNLKNAALAVQQAIGGAGIYTSRSKWSQLATADAGWINIFPVLWLAQYPVKDAAGTRYTREEIAALPLPSLAPWGWPDFWQFTDREDGLKYGLESKAADMNRFDGSPLELHDLCLNLPEPPATLTVEQEIADLQTRVKRLEQIAGIAK